MRVPFIIIIDILTHWKNCENILGIIVVDSRKSNHNFAVEQAIHFKQNSYCFLEQHLEFESIV